MLDAKKFGRRISELRHKANLTQRDVAQNCFVSVQAVSKWERGLCFPDIQTLDELAAVLMVEIKDLFEEECALLEEEKINHCVNEVRNG